MRICGPAGATGKGTYGAGVGEGDSDALGEGEGEGDSDGEGDSEGDGDPEGEALAPGCGSEVAWATTIGPALACGSGVLQPPFISETAFEPSSSPAETGPGIEHNPNESATSVTPIRRKKTLTGLRARPASSPPPP